MYQSHKPKMSASSSAGTSSNESTEYDRIARLINLDAYLRSLLAEEFLNENQRTTFARMRFILVFGEILISRIANQEQGISDY